MDCHRGRKRTETPDPSPADKRACSSIPSAAAIAASSSSNKSDSSSTESSPPSPPPPPPPPSTAAEHHAAENDMDASSSTASEMDPAADDSHASNDGDDDDGGGTEDDDEEDDVSDHEVEDVGGGHGVGAYRWHSKEEIDGVLAALGSDTCEGSQLAALTQICDMLSFGSEESLAYLSVDTFAPHLVSLAGHESNPEIMLLAIRAITYVCDLLLRSATALVKHGVLPVLCRRLMSIEYLDVAEQSLQALEKISGVQPVSCLQAGTVMAALAYLDFFSTSIQRVALSIIANVCKKLPEDFPPFVMEAIPILCNLLQYEDRKLVEIVAICLIRLAEGSKGSPDVLDELCKYGAINHSVNLIASDSHMTLSPTTYTGLIGLLTSLASCSLVAVKTLFYLNISSTLREILAATDNSRGMPYPLLGNGHSDQVYEVLKLLSQLLPPIVTEDKNNQLVLAKKKILQDEPRYLFQLGTDILPLLIQVANTGVSLFVCYGCVLILSSIVYFSSSDMLIDLLKNTNISSFLAGIFTQKDPHVLIPALKTVEILLERHPNECIGPFIKEGVAYAINALLMPENCKQSMAESSHMHPNSSSEMTVKDVSRCLCYTFDPCSSTLSQSEICKLGQDHVRALAKHINNMYLTTVLRSPEMGLTEVFRKLKNFSAVLNDNVSKFSKGDYCAENEEYLKHILDEIMTVLSVGELMSTFEFVESGVIRSLAYYLSNGMYLQGKVDDLNLTNHVFVVLKRFQTLATICLSKSGQHWENVCLAVLVQKLQSALSSLDNFPVISSVASKHRSVYADIPVRHSTMLPCLKVCFVCEEEETSLSDYSAKVLTIELSSSLDAIEEYLWPKVSHQKAEGHAELAAKSMTETGEDLSVAEVKVSEDPVLVCKHAGERTFINRHAGITDEPQIITSSLLEGTTVQELNSQGVDASMKVVVPATEDPSNLEFSSRRHDEGIINSVSHSKKCAPPKLNFYLERKQLNRSQSLYEAILQQRLNADRDFTVGPKFWNEVYKVTYKRAEPNVCTSEASSQALASVPLAKTRFSLLNLPIFSSMLVGELPCELENSNPSYDILFVLKVLEILNQVAYKLLSYEEIDEFAEGKIVDFDNTKVKTSAIPQTEFLSNKITEKLKQQMRDHLSLSTGCMPSWCSQLVFACPFLFSFEARWDYFHLTVFGSSRIKQRTMSQWHDNTMNSANDRWSHSGSPRHKRFTVSRSNILESAAKIMSSHAHSRVAIEVEYIEEVGIGSGPTLEFYTLVSREFQMIGLGMWRGDHSSSISSIQSVDSGYVMAPLGLFPRPWSPSTTFSNGIQFSEVTKQFILLGRLIAKALKDGRVLDLPFSKAFYKLLLEQELDAYDILSFDPELGKALLGFQALIDRKALLESSWGKNGGPISDICFRGARIEQLCLDFTLPGYDDYPLASGGNSKMVDITNLEEYISLVVDATTRSGICRQMEAFKSGFDEVFPLKSLQIFTEDDLERLICGQQDNWTFNELLDNIKFDHGYTANSPPVLSLLETIQEFNHGKRRAFLQFVTGAPRLPPGGLATLNPKLTIVRKHCRGSADSELPSVMTCANYLKLPPYSSKEITRERLLYAITEGQGSFHLS